ncbi:MAG: thioredoxin family protein, partial [bacterium]
PRVRTDIVEASEFPSLAQQYSVYAVPKTVINETREVVGAVPEATLLDAVLTTVAPNASPPATVSEEHATE